MRGLQHQHLRMRLPLIRVRACMELQANKNGFKWPLNSFAKIFVVFVNRRCMFIFHLHKWAKSAVKFIISGHPFWFMSWRKQIQSTGHLRKHRNTLCLSPQFLHKHCFQFLLGLTKVPRENNINAYAKFGGDKQRVLWYFPKWPIACLAYARTKLKTLWSFLTLHREPAPAVRAAVKTVLSCQSFALSPETVHFGCA